MTSHSSDRSEGENRVSLAGTWRRTLPGTAYDFVAVPGSYLSVGECLLERTIEVDWDAAKGQSRYFLVTEGVLSSAEFSLNGQVLGGAGPFATYRFEIPQALLQQSNVVAAKVRDITESFGPTPGRCFEGGLVRELYLERRPATFIESVAFRTELSNDFATARCCVEIALDGPGNGVAHVALREKDAGEVAASLSADPRQPVRFEVARPRLWSPERPDLYTLRIEFTAEGETQSDIYEEAVGFRTIEVRGQDFYLNGKRLLLKGVCRHEFTPQSGFAVPYDEVRRDLAMIKHAGFNFVRLVHAPHSRQVPQLAAELGLLVSEEPGACWYYLSDPDYAEPSLESLRRTVLRDRNCPSVFAWSLFNECHIDVGYVVRGAELCRDLDPGRLITTADDFSHPDLTDEMMEKANLSYYGINHYSPELPTYTRLMAKYTDRPLVLTEWGGWMFHANQRFLQLLCDTFVKHAQEGASPRLAGCCYWVWQDYDERSRNDPANVEGWTVEGLLDREGRPRPDLQLVSTMGFDMDHPRAPRRPKVEVLSKYPRLPGNWRPVPLDVVTGDQSSLERAVEDLRSHFSYLSPIFGRLVVAGVEFDCADSAEAGPLLLGPGREQLVIPVKRRVQGIAFLGHVALKGGYPSNRKNVGPRGREEIAVTSLGQPASHYEFVFEDGTVAQPLLHGCHVLRSNAICAWWRTEPQATEIIPALQAELHPQFEILRFNLWHMALEGPRYLREIRWQCDDPDSIQALLAVSVDGVD